MKWHKDSLLLISVSLIATIAVILGASSVRFKPLPFPKGFDFTRFSYERVQIVKRPLVSTLGLKSPVDIPEPSVRDFPSTSLAKVAPPPEEKEHKVSFILIKDHTRIAILDGQVVREGEDTKAGRVVTIKKDGILIKDREGEKWQTIK